jgi:uncharacterized protein (DUF2132 family)
MHDDPGQATTDHGQGRSGGGWLPPLMLNDMPQPVSHPRDPLHGITLERILKELVARHGWAEMGHRIPIRCFQFDPSVKSSLTFLRKTPWARTRVESWFLEEGLKSETNPTSPH